MKHRIRMPQGHLRMAGLIAMALLANPVLAGDSYTVHNGTIAGGGGLVEADCFRLVGTIGEAVASTTSGGNYRLTSGFPATLTNGSSTPPGGGGLIFSDGFEGQGQTGDPVDNSGACTP